MENEMETDCTKCGDPIFYNVFAPAPYPLAVYGYYALAGYLVPSGVCIVGGVLLCTPCARVIDVAGA